MEAVTGFTSYKIKQIDFKYREISDKLPQISDQIELFQFQFQFQQSYFRTRRQNISEILKRRRQKYFGNVNVIVNIYNSVLLMSWV